MVDAIGRTLIRLLVTRRKSVAVGHCRQANLSSRLDLKGAYRRMGGGLAIAIAAPSWWSGCDPMPVVGAPPISATLIINFIYRF